MCSEHFWETLKNLSQNLNNLEQAQKDWSGDSGSAPWTGRVLSPTRTLDRWIRCTTLNWIRLCLELTEEECILLKTALQVSFSNVILKSSSQRDLNDLLDGVCLLFILYIFDMAPPIHLYWCKMPSKIPLGGAAGNLIFLWKSWQVVVFFQMLWFKRTFVKHFLHYKCYKISVEYFFF